MHPGPTRATETDSVAEEVALAPEASTTVPSAPVADLQVAPEVPAAAETTAPAQEVAPQATIDPAGQQTFTVKVNGEDVPVTLDEALNGYMRQADYTRKTQEVALQREDLTYAQRIAEALEENPQRAIQALVTAYGVEGAQQFVAPQAPQPVAPEPLDPQEAMFAKVESFMAQQEMRTFEAQVTADLAEMHQQLGAFNDADVIQYAVEHSIPDVKEAAKAFAVDRVFSTAQRQVADRQAEAAKAAAATIAGGHGVAGGTVQTGGTAPVNSLEDAYRLAVAAHPGVIS